MKEKRGSFNDRVLIILQNILAVLLLLIALLTADNLLSFAIIFMGVTIGTNIAYFSKKRGLAVSENHLKKWIVVPSVLLLLAILFIYLDLNAVWIGASIILLIIGVVFSFLVISNKYKK
ncbi:hypothetical protein [Natronoflexus pectinivorans]|uniref:Uncharacterized protein n=1 Tax=Natronoflexus pectinivorans TaxID=682526 RepID=A0A4R2GIV4_9BACT|nr:hypothetical protein [Natronoflexus pectinivorans]TCO08335.1 hypothetical protein EV194_105139 [Natronoflexus pectinivorans]